MIPYKYKEIEVLNDDERNEVLEKAKKEEGSQKFSDMITVLSGSCDTEMFKRIAPDLAFNYSQRNSMSSIILYNGGGFKIKGNELGYDINEDKRIIVNAKA